MKKRGGRYSRLQGLILALLVGLGLCIFCELRSIPTQKRTPAAQPPIVPPEVLPTVWQNQDPGPQKPSSKKLSEAQLMSLFELFESYRSAFEDKTEEIQNLFETDPALSIKILSFLKSVPVPDMIPHRMSGIDILESLASSSHYSEETRLGAQEGLAELVKLPFPRGLDSDQKRIVVAEKYDALGSLAAVSPEYAIQVFNSLTNKHLREILRPSLTNALAARR